MTEYWSPSESDGQYHSLRNGMTSAQLTANDKNKLASTSNIGSRWSVDAANTNRHTVMYAAEAYFLRAEGALNGWNMGGTAQELYEQGIATSLSQWGIADNTVIQNYISGTGTPVALDDYFSSPAVADIPVAFSSDPEVAREQVLTQKWLALFPDGIEAWAEVRRTGFPKLYPVINSDNPDVSTDDIIRRFTFLNYEYQTNGKAVEATGIPLLGGPDKASTRVWWNK